MWGIIKVQAQVRAIQKAGDPVTLQDLEDMAQKIPLQEDAAAFYEAVFACLVLDDMNETLRDQLPSIWQIKSGEQGWPLAQADREWVRDVLAADHEALALLKDAPEIQGRVYDGLCADWPGSSTSRMETLGDVVDLLLLQAIYAVDQADAATLVDSIRTTLRVADTLREEPLGFASGHRFNYVNQTLQVLGWASGLMPISRDQQQALDRSLAGMTWPLSLRERLASERCALRVIYQNPTPDILEYFSVSNRQGTRPIISPGRVLAYQWSGLYRHSEAHFLEQSSRIVDTWGKWTPGQAKSVRRNAVAQNRPPQLPKALMRAMGLEDPAGKMSMTSLFVSLAESECIRSIRVRAKLQVERAVLAARQYHQQTGRWPQTLDDLVPGYLRAVPTDPYSSSPIQLGSRQGGVAIFSVGSDLRASQEQYFKDESGRRTGDDTITWLEPPDVHPDKP